MTDQHGVKANSDVYIEIAVEQVDLKSLFDPICERFCIPLQNIKGWADINDRAGMMKRFAKWERCGKRCILLLCGDHDPGGLQISTNMRSNLGDPSRTVDWEPDRLEIERFGLKVDFIKATA